MPTEDELRRLEEEDVYWRNRKRQLLALVLTTIVSALTCVVITLVMLILQKL